MKTSYIKKEKLSFVKSRKIIISGSKKEWGGYKYEKKYHILSNTWKLLLVVGKERDRLYKFKGTPQF